MKGLNLLMSAWVYILTNKPRGTLYTGVTNDLVRRVAEHRDGLVEGFTKKHGLKMLVYFEEHATVPLAIQREKNVKHWVRQWKVDLIEGMNPKWEDLWGRITR
jgi:putative endonuclease